MQKTQELKPVRQFQKVCDILEKYHYDKTKLIPILQEIQEEYRYLPKKILNFAATSLEIPPAKIFGVASFYSHFAFEPKGKYVIKICDGTACHVKGSMKLHEAIKKQLKLEEGKKTTSDMLFTLETVSCLGACGLAPAMVVNEDVHGNLTPEKAVEIIKTIQKQENN
ncbi:MAG: NADH-quinone oxidoreductase subunit NuoE [Candidatus Marinimicrobia bacterium]|nr:NADH-quinone oxidoreductase subunit NuoE [Candidatus Neomarinimicrobiota bacterium]